MAVSDDVFFIQWCQSELFNFPNFFNKFFVLQFFVPICEFFQFSGFDLVGPVSDVFFNVHIFKFSLVLFTVDFRHLVGAPNLQTPGGSFARGPLAVAFSSRTGRPAVGFLACRLV